ncbi:hypothetical protein [Streptomyces eurocidicus]|uniref:Uncharacterized protein n=1 Tax=Streptomyces eurocidicus TaxID=66423 RepID=A0A7W8BH26_STREU|nr:hypothetical protein [Streptomyces eurocidicus]MBB5123235.1 hypothetical protein [Streptomyces eurocidicus]MBF6056174.1 hypothetical protein [Streptomyces eurocidicus]
MTAGTLTAYSGSNCTGTAKATVTGEQAFNPPISPIYSFRVVRCPFT